RPAQSESPPKHTAVEQQPSQESADTPNRTLTTNRVERLESTEIQPDADPQPRGEPAPTSCAGAVVVPAICDRPGRLGGSPARCGKVPWSRRVSRLRGHGDRVRVSVISSQVGNSTAASRSSWP